MDSDRVLSSRRRGEVVLIPRSWKSWLNAFSGYCRILNGAGLTILLSKCTRDEDLEEEGECLHGEVVLLFAILGVFCTGENMVLQFMIHYVLSTVFRRLWFEFYSISIVAWCNI